ncbi:MAG: extracellular solute-binding protein [Ilumatobacteraceae bacterium]
MNRRLLLTSSVFLVAGLFGASCSEDKPDLTIYSGRTDDLIGPLLKDFTEATGIKVEVKYGQSPDLALLIDEEAEAGKVSADLFISQSPGAMGYLEDRDRLQTMPASALDLVPVGVRDDDNHWVGLTGRQRVLVYNTNSIDASTLPTSVFGLTDAAWSGKIGVAPGNGSFQDFVTAMRVTEGEAETAAFLEGLAANDPVTYENNNAIVEAVARGEVEVGLVNHYYNYRRLVELPSSPTANHVFDEGDPGALLIITGVAAIEGSNGGDKAMELVKWLLGPQAQEYFANETFEYPLANGTSPSGEIPAIGFSDVGGIDFADLGAGVERTRQMITDAGLSG